MTEMSLMIDTTQKLKNKQLVIITSYFKNQGGRYYFNCIYAFIAAFWVKVFTSPLISIFSFTNLIYDIILLYTAHKQRLNTSLYF